MEAVTLSASQDLLFLLYLKADEQILEFDLQEPSLKSPGTQYSMHKTVSSVNILML